MLKGCSNAPLKLQLGRPKFQFFRPLKKYTVKTKRYAYYLIKLFSFNFFLYLWCNWSIWKATPWSQESFLVAYLNSCLLLSLCSPCPENYSTETRTFCSQLSFLVANKMIIINHRMLSWIFLGYCLWIIRADCITLLR